MLPQNPQIEEFDRRALHSVGFVAARPFKQQLTILVYCGVLRCSSCHTTLRMKSSTVELFILRVLWQLDLSNSSSPSELLDTRSSCHKTLRMQSSTVELFILRVLWQLDLSNKTFHKFSQKFHRFDKHFSDSTGISPIRFL